MPIGLGRIATAAALAVAVSGCLGGSPKPTYYTLAASAPPAETALAARPDLGVVVGPIEFPRYLDRPEVVTRDGSHALALSNEHRWAGSLRNDFGRVLADEIGRRLGTARMATHPADARFAVDYRVPLELIAFEGPLGGRVALRARWSIVGPAGPIASEASAIEEPAASASYADLVAAQGRAVSRLAAEIAARIAAIPVQPARPARR